MKSRGCLSNVRDGALIAVLTILLADNIADALGWAKWDQIQTAGILIVLTLVLFGILYIHRMLDKTG